VRESPVKIRSYEIPAYAGMTTPKKLYSYPFKSIFRGLEGYSDISPLA
jgi:hypothetical protein